MLSDACAKVDVGGCVDAVLRSYKKGEIHFAPDCSIESDALT